MLERYSIVFHPSPEVIEQIQLLKTTLATAIGWYPSRNSIAHITIQEFVVDQTKIPLIHRQLERCTNCLNPQEVHFDRFDTFPNGAFFVQPDLTTQRFLSDIMKRIQIAVPTPNTHRGTSPHMTVARRLTDPQIAIAHHLFPSISLRYLCDTIALRQFNTVKKQFEIIGEYPFLDLPDTSEIQGSLF